MRKRRIVELGLVLLCTNLILVAASVPDQGLRDARSAASATGAMLSRAAQVAAPDQQAAPSATARSVITPKTQQVQTPNALLRNAPELAASPVASKSQATPAQNSIVKTEAQPQHQQGTQRAPGNDDCANAIVFDLLDQPVMFCDDNTGATEDCAALSGGVYGESWYKFTTYQMMNVAVRYCGTTPAFYNAYIVMDTTCPCSGAFLFASSWENTSCGDGNWTLNWLNLAPGTYYWPLLKDSAGGYAEGPYCVTFVPSLPPPGQECPANTMYGQTPMDQGGAWGAYTSAVTTQFQYKCFDNYSVSDKVGDLHWWGLSLFFNPYYGWMLCDPTGMTFNVEFYADNGGGQPGALNCAYPGVAPVITDVGPFSWAELYYFSLDALQPCCTLFNGWVAVQSQLNAPDCAFLWMNSATGDYSAWQDQGGVLVQLNTNLSFCVTSGDCPLIYGACCDDYTGVCTDNLEWAQCVPPLRFTPNTLCADITPTCGIRGACCDAGLNCIFTGFESECDAVGGRFFPGQTCPEFVCPADCEHRIDLWDCYGDGWNGNTLDVLVNGVTVLSQITLPNGLGPLSFYFTAATGDTIQTIYYPIGGWPYEPYYYIYDGLGYLLGLDGIDGTNCYVQPTGITVAGNCNPPTSGACCYYAGGCDMVPDAASCLDGEFLGLGYQCIECPCYVACPPEGSPEPEPCGDDTDGGCNASPPAFAPLVCGQTICGTTWANTSLRDTDWYQLTLDSSQYLTWTAEAEVPVLLFIMEGAGPNDCSSYTILASATASECELASAVVAGGPGNTYWFWVGPQAWNNWPCSVDYTAALTCAPYQDPYGACCLSNGTCIPNVTQEMCANGCGGDWQGGGTDCDPNPCEVVPGCGPPAYGGCDEYIARVQLGAIDNSTGCTGYGDYTYLSADVPYAVPTQMIVTNGNPIWTADVCTYWIDFNHDGVLSASERGQLITGVGPYVFSITPPPDALPGPTCMRIRIDYANSNPQPCGNTPYGEVEDYSVNIVEVTGACCWPDGTCTNELPSACGGYWNGPFTQCAGQDCNTNGADDLCDIISGYSFDCDSNDVPDECQPFVDCNSNGVADFCDVANGTSPDCNENGVPDECDVASGTSLDCQPDGIPDECQLGGGLNLQIDDGTSENNWGLTAGGELCWINHFTATGLISAIGVTFGTPAYPGSSGVTPGQEFRVYVWGDANGDGVPSGADFLASALGSVDAGSIDTDVVQAVPLDDPLAVSGSFFIGASVPTAAGGYPGTADDDGQSQIDQAFLTFNNVPFDPTNLSSLYAMSQLGYPTTVFILRAVGGGSGDCNGNGIPDECDTAEDPSIDCNGNLIPDECEPGGTADCDHDGTTDLCTIAYCEGVPWCSDCNGNYVPDACDIAAGTSLDCNSNGVPDECDVVNDPAIDCNGNGIPDECDIANCGGEEGWCCDCDLNGVLDICEIWQGGARGGDYPLQWDDGSTEGSIGLTAGGELCWLAHFTKPVGQPTCYVSQILTSFGTPLYPGSSGVSEGQSVRVYVWNDPNGDGDPAEAVFLGEAAGTVEASAIDTDVPQSIAVNIGELIADSFFVGASVVTTSGHPAPMDQDGPQYNQAWLVFNTVPFDPQNFGAQLYNMSDIGYVCNWMLRTVVYCGAPPNDCNNNGIIDVCDIGVEWGGQCGVGGPPCFPPVCSSDWNHNGIPDGCENCGDLDNDANVDLDDFWLFVDAFGECAGSPKYNVLADLDGDGCVTLVDYQAWRMCYLMANGQEFVPPKPQPLPRPGLAK